MAAIRKNPDEKVIALDVSAAADVLLKFEPRASRIRERMRKSEGGIHVPHIFELEVLNTLRRHFLSGNLSEEREAEALEDLSDLKLTRYPHTPFVERIWELKENITAYDASYIALSETLDTPLVTTDGRLARSTGHRARVEFYE